MPIEYLDHVNLRTAQLETMIGWYEEVLGLTAGDRPPSSSTGAWLYAGSRAVVHLVSVGSDPGAGSDEPLKLEHFAFMATGLAAFEGKLRVRGERYHRADQSATGLVQMNVWDPDGNHIHIDFRADE